MPSLSELEANPPNSRLERSFEVVLDAALVRRIADLTAEAATLEQSRKPAARARYGEIIEEITGLQPDLDKKSGTLVLRNNLTSGEWRRFVDENPPRSEGEVGYDRDQQRTEGMVNADALIDAVGLFAHSWDGETLTPAQRDATGNVVALGQFDRLLRDNIAPGDLAEMATAIVLMYETTTDFGKWRTALSNGLERLSGFAELSTSESAPSGSTVGSPEASNEATTETDSE